MIRTAALALILLATPPGVAFAQEAELSAEDVRVLAYDLANAGDLGRAAELGEALLERDPDDVAALLLLALISSDTGQTRASIGYAHRAFAAAEREEDRFLGARLAGGSLGFLPLSLAGLGALTVSGTAERRLSGWIGGAHHAVLAALLHLDRLRRWQGRATEATADLSGRMPTRLVAVLARLPMVSAPVAEAETGASRAAVQRNLDRLMSLGLLREITGQGRYRVWTAVL